MKVKDVMTRDVRTILASVRDEGDAALHAFTRKFDGHDLNDTGWRIERSEWEAAYHGLDPDLRDALDLAAARIRTYHERQRPADSDTVDELGVTRRPRERRERGPHGPTGPDAKSEAQGRDHETEAEMAVSADGRLLGFRVNTLANLGAY